MSGKQNDDFFEELDKTADLLRTFKPSIEQPKKIDLDDIEKLYKDFLAENKEESRIIEKKEEKADLKTPKKEEKSLTKEPKKVSTEKKKSNISPAKKKEEIKVEKKTENPLSKISDKKEETKKKTTSKVSPAKKEIKKIESKKTKEIPSKQKKSIPSKTIETDSKRVEIPKKVTKRKLKKGVLELFFCACSFLFMIGCICYYGSRLIKYYKIYNPKNDSGEVLSLLATEIARNSSIVYEGEGLYMQGGDYIYKGSNVNNYVEYSNLLWRIMKTNADGTIDLILDDYINVLPFSNEYSTYYESDIHKWLNEYFLTYLSQEYLTGTKICIDTINDLNNYACDSSNSDSYVRLPSVKEYLNSKVDEYTYMSDENSSLWLSTVSEDGAWQINGNNLSIALESRFLGLKPVITLKIGIALLEGSGTKENPYRIEKEDASIHIGDYVQLENDIYVVYHQEEDKIFLALNDYLPTTYRFDISTNIYNLDTEYSLAYYLNNIYYESLSYKNKILDSKWDTGIYKDSYQDIKDSTITAKVGLLSLENLKFNNELTDYFLLNGIDEFNYLYENELIVSKPSISRKIRPCIVISKGTIKSGNGSIENPYVVED